MTTAVEFVTDRLGWPFTNLGSGFEVITPYVVWKPKSETLDESRPPPWNSLLAPVLRLEERCIETCFFRSMAGGWKKVVVVPTKFE